MAISIHPYITGVPHRIKYLEALLDYVLGHDGVAPPDFNAIAREEVRRYGTEVLDGRVVDVTRSSDDRFRLALAGLP